MTKANLVTSIRGPLGGFVLNKDPHEISFLDIYEVVEGRINFSSCVFNKKECAFKECIFGYDLNSISQDVYEKLKDTKLSDFA